MSSDREPQDEVTLRLYMADAIEADLIEAVEEVMKDGFRDIEIPIHVHLICIGVS